jgi:hypothetical protein
VVAGAFSGEDRLVCDLRVIEVAGRSARWSGRREGTAATYATWLGALAREAVAALGADAAPAAALAPPTAPYGVAPAWWRARRLIERGESAAAIADLMRVVQAEPGFAAAWTDLGLALALNGQQAAAGQAIVRGIEADPAGRGDPVGILRLALRLAATRPAAARSLCRLAAERFPASISTGYILLPAPSNMALPPGRIPDLAEQILTMHIPAERP